MFNIALGFSIGMFLWCFCDFLKERDNLNLFFTLAYLICIIGLL